MNKEKLTLILNKLSVALGLAEEVEQPKEEVTEVTEIQEQIDELTEKVEAIEEVVEETPVVEEEVATELAEEEVVEETPASVTREEFDSLKSMVEELKSLLGEKETEVAELKTELSAMPVAQTKLDLSKNEPVQLSKAQQRLASLRNTKNQ